MIDVPELDVFLKAVYYAYNSNTPIYRGIISQELQSCISFIGINNGIFEEFQRLVQKPEFGFNFSIGKSNSMYGLREIRGMFDPTLLLPAPFLKIYPRLLYANNFINTAPNFDQHEYCFRYYPKMMVRIYRQTEDGQGVILVPSTHWIVGTHTPLENGRCLISYNVAVNVDLSTIVEEELHDQIPDLHHTQNTQQVTERINGENPTLRDEIVANLNRILSTEEKKFKDLGNMLRIECASELRILQNFVDCFEHEVIKSTDIGLPPDPTVNQ